MLKKTITYTDYNGVERTEDFWFNLSHAELSQMQLSTSGGMVEMMERIVAAQDAPELIRVFTDLIKASYGVKSPDGKYFRKVDKDGYRLVDDFAQTEAYSKLYVELTTNTNAASEFFKGVIPDAEKSTATAAIQ